MRSFFSLFTLLSLVASRNNAEYSTIQTTQGKLRGYIDKSFGSETGIYLGIPFAKPPIGQLRFTLPQASLAWDGILDATHYRPACLSDTISTRSRQHYIDEDCLYLNIVAGRKCQINTCPVIVYLHGGSFYFDSAIMFNLTVINEKYASKEVIFVIPAYRLGIFGFIGLGDDIAAPRNLGFHDMILALKWVQKEISAFGGDPRRVTIMGNSAGGLAVTLLTQTPAVPDDLFAQGIAMSSIDQYRKNLNLNISMGIAYLTRCANRSEHTSNQAIVDCLRKKSAKELLHSQKLLTDSNLLDLMFGPEPETNLFPVSPALLMKKNNIARQMPFGPEPDGTLFPAEYATLFKNDNTRRHMIGITKDDSTVSFARSSYRECITWLGVFGYSQERTRLKCAAKYRNVPAVVQKDETRASTYRLALKLAAGAETFLYSFDMPGHRRHSSDLSFVLGVHPIHNMNSDEEYMDWLLPEMIRNFVKTGNPGNGRSLLTF
ncbi:hypothetical protein AB6A40_009023 [Gnathostoma spinigerum]|uniref:Carboxylic ester hydrolase n=1 Tax=Gnathostoma spinigerum TaxID=75299 RepID=A0ABD6EVV1_9BILA